MPPSSVTHLTHITTTLFVTIFLVSCGTTSRQATSSLKPSDRASAVICVPPMATLYGNGGGGLGAAVVGDIINAIRVKDSQIPRDEAFSRSVRAVIEDELARSTSFQYVRAATLSGMPMPDTRDKGAYYRLKPGDIARAHDLRICFKINTLLVYKERHTFSLLSSPAVSLYVNAATAEGASLYDFSDALFQVISTPEEEADIKSDDEVRKTTAYLQMIRRATQKFVTNWARKCADARAKNLPAEMRQPPLEPDSVQPAA